MSNVHHRFVPQRSLPPYSYVPGQFPHPISDTAGHSFGHPAPPLVAPSDACPQNCEPLLWGFDLFNQGYYWEAHESWEQVWLALNRKGDAADIVKAMIKLAAAGVKAREGRLKGVQSHTRRAMELVENVRQRETHVLGIELSSLLDLARRILDLQEAILDVRELPVVVVMPIPLTMDSGVA